MQCWSSEGPTTNRRRKKTTLRWFFFVQVEITWRLPKQVQRAQQVQQQMRLQQVQQQERVQQQEQLLLFYRKRPEQLQR
jgi:hypothetical protein